MGVVQHVQVRGAADGAQHGLRAGPEAHPRQHPQPGSHLHKVRSKLTYVASFVPSPACASSPGVMEWWIVADADI